MQNYRIYADICCLNRPLDALQQPRVKLESEAILAILEKCEQREWTLLNSEAIRFEIAKNRDPIKKEQLETIISVATTDLTTNPEIIAISQSLTQIGFTTYDALHLAFAQHYQADIFLTTDDRLLKKATKQTDLITIPTANPVIWLMNTLQE
jgi:predicted nucleic acid-binding protein